MAAARPVRKDAKTRSIPTINNSGLVNRDPGKYYVAANRSTGAVEEYEYMGYAIEYFSETGVKFAAGKTVKVGEPLEYRGHVLMSILSEEREHIERFGIDGESGTHEADALEERIVDKAGVQNDLMRGMRSRYVRAESEIQPLQKGY